MQYQISLVILLLCLRRGSSWYDFRVLLLVPLLRWLPGYENGRSAQIFAQPVNGLWQNLIS